MMYVRSMPMERALEVVALVPKATLLPTKELVKALTDPSKNVNNRHFIMVSWLAAMCWCRKKIGFDADADNL